jgi:hypothetical protein
VGEFEKKGLLAVGKSFHIDPFVNNAPDLWGGKGELKIFFSKLNLNPTWQEGNHYFTLLERLKKFLLYLVS